MLQEEVVEVDTLVYFRTCAAQLASGYDSGV